LDTASGIVGLVGLALAVTFMLVLVGAVMLFIALLFGWVEVSTPAR
jgi:hypothetical protein